MLTEFEKALLGFENLDDVRVRLLNDLNRQRYEKTQKIEHDYNVSLLIREALVSEPVGSAGYAVAKGIMNRLREKYRDKGSEKLIRKLKRSVRKEKTYEQSTGTQKTDNGTIKRSESSTEGLSEQIPEGASRKGEEMES